MIKLDNYTPIGNDILLKVEEVNITRRGIIMPKAQLDRVMRVLKTGILVEAVKPGDWVLIGPSGREIVQMPMKDGDKGILTVQTSIHSIIGTYDKDPDEGVVFVTEDGQPVEEPIGPQNIIDNPGIDHAPFLKKVNAEA